MTEYEALDLAIEIIEGRIADFMFGDYQDNESTRSIIKQYSLVGKILAELQQKYDNTEEQIGNEQTEEKRDNL